MDCWTYEVIIRVERRVVVEMPEMGARCKIMTDRAGLGQKRADLTGTIEIPEPQFDDK